MAKGGKHEKSTEKAGSICHAFGSGCSSDRISGICATSVTGSWANEDGGWKFYNSDHQAYTGWVKTENGWYYLNPTDGKMVTGWQKIDGFWYYFETAQEGIEGTDANRMV